MTKPSEGRGGSEPSDVPTVVERRPADATPDTVETSIRTSHVVLTEEIGRGGMGVIFRGEQVDLARAIAFKQLPSESNDTQRARFLREARITAQLDHPNVVPVHFLEPGMPAGYVMKLVEGKTLRALLQETIEAYERGDTLDDEHASSTRLEHFLKICDALAFAHSKGVLHRDLKPANVMIGKFGEVYVMDWGIARRLGTEDSQDPEGDANGAGDAALTRVGAVMGSPTYMSPEQAEGRNEDLDARSDQYALGLIRFEIVSLRRAIRKSSSVTDAVELAARGEMMPLEHVSAKERIPVELRAIVEKATARRPEDRYPSVLALADDVRRALRGEAVIARPDRPVAKLLRAMSKHRRATLAVVVSALVLAALVALSAQLRKKAAELASRERGERQTALYIDVDLARSSHRRAVPTNAGGARRASHRSRMGALESRLLVTVVAHLLRCRLRRPREATKRLHRSNVVSVAGVRGLPGCRRRTRREPRSRPPEDSQALAITRAHARDVRGRSNERPRRPHVPGAARYRTSASWANRLCVRGSRRGRARRLSRDEFASRRLRRPHVELLSDIRSQTGKRWGPPYVDATTDEKGDDLVLPCTEGLWSPEGEFLGVAGVEFTVTKIVDKGLALPTRKTLRTSLLDGEGRKVIDFGDANKRFPSSGKDDGLVLADFDVPEIVRGIRDGTEGLREIHRAGRAEVVAFARLDVLGWYYVVEVDASTLAD